MNNTSASFDNTPSPPGRGERASISAYRTEASSHLRQAGQHQARQPRIASHVATDQAGGLAATAVGQSARPSREHGREVGALGWGKVGRRRHAVGITLGEQHRITRAQMQGRLALKFDEALSFCDEVKDHDPLRTGLQIGRSGIGIG